MKICTLGLGYIGLPTSLMFAKHGVDVVGVDIHPNIISNLNLGRLHLEEPGLEEVLHEVLDSGKFQASLRPEYADVFIVAVPTPNNNDMQKSCDLTHVAEATASILPFIRKGNIIIIESTIAPRSMDDHIRPMIEMTGLTIGKDIFLVHCPERVLPGRILEELVHNNRIVGGITETCSYKGSLVYQTFVKGEIIQTDAKTAEMSKLMENTFRDVNIALANELAKVCFELDINVLDVISMANKHPRVNLHQPGPGVGGHCLAVDPYFVVAKSPETARIIKLARDTNVSMPYHIVNCVRMMLEGIERPKVAVFGLSYKGNVDDIRESPAIDVVNILMGMEQMEVALHDPHVQSGMLPIVSVEDAVNDADLILVLTDHDEFKVMDYDDLSKLMANKMILDTRNCIDVTKTGVSVANLGNIYQYKKVSREKARNKAIS
ncbi:UDP-N-acetyl-D-mannosamine dehydrogenase [Peribacillus muralis]|uniref:UDP-N-acetyl-D-mannosamine dehydrogenase n=1 Tax=Peribacillus muralis TaxID=264697 RepID=A0A1B3XUA3_9BACI|nr:nucleotide sugar dehydrogenase [Peribacillus muralis]AOH56789.1 UDP-N-acetyl-D-mannosamine dehydrogenase [Peribacillus muralis]